MEKKDRQLVVIPFKTEMNATYLYLYIYGGIYVVIPFKTEMNATARGVPMEE